LALFPGRFWINLLILNHFLALFTLEITRFAPVSRLDRLSG
jgi:hypothetical protein